MTSSQHETAEAFQSNYVIQLIEQYLQLRFQTQINVGLEGNVVHVDVRNVHFQPLTQMMFRVSDVGESGQDFIRQLTTVLERQIAGTLEDLALGR